MDEQRARRYRLFLLLLVLATMLQGCTAAKQGNKPLLVQYFYQNICGSCDMSGDFLRDFEQHTGISRDTPNLKIETYNVYEDQAKAVFDREMDKLGVPESGRMLPLLRIGDQVVPPGRIKEELTGGRFASALPDMADTVPANASVVVYFHVPGCRDCETAEETVLGKLPRSIGTNKSDSAVHIISVTASGKDGIALFRAYCETYRVPAEKQRTPLAFIGYRILQGPEEIGQLPELLEKGEGLNTPVLRADETETSDGLQGYGWPGVFATGLLNGFNPCAISMVLLLLSLLAMKKEWIVPVGLAFALGKFAGFLLLGTVLYSTIGAIQLTGLQLVFKIVLGAFAAIMIALNLNDFLAASKENYRGIRLQLPVRMRRWNHGLIKRATALNSPVALVASALVLGLIVAGGEFLCTGQIYIAVILQVANSTDRLAGQALGYLVVYSLAFMLPMIVLTLLVGKGRQVFDLSEFFRRNMQWVKLANAVIFISILLFLFIYQ